MERCISFAVDIAGMAPSTPRAKKRELERQIDDILTASTSCSVARELIGKIARARDQLLVFCFPGEVEPANNGSERELRPAVIQQCEWSVGNYRNAVYHWARTAVQHGQR